MQGKWRTADGKDPLFGRVDGFQIDPNTAASAPTAVLREDKLFLGQSKQLTILLQIRARGLRESGNTGWTVFPSFFFLCLHALLRPLPFPGFLLAVKISLAPGLLPGAPAEIIGKLLLRVPGVFPGEAVLRFFQGARGHSADGRVVNRISAWRRHDAPFLWQHRII